jgi:hypothetical protein
MLEVPTKRHISEINFLKITIERRIAELSIYIGRIPKMEVASFQWCSIATYELVRHEVDCCFTSGNSHQVLLTEALAALTAKKGATKILISVKKLRRHCKVRMSQYRKWLDL